MSTQKSPWRLTENGTIRNVDGQSVAKVQRHHNVDWQENGRLIAAAPELLEALEYALPYLRACVPRPRNGINADCSVDVNCVDRARAAIAKATGGDV